MQLFWFVLRFARTPGRRGRAVTLERQEMSVFVLVLAMDTYTALLEPFSREFWNGGMGGGNFAFLTTDK